VPWYAWVQKVLPGYETFRIPSKHLGLAALALSLAAGLGIEHLRGQGFALAALGSAVTLGAASLTFAWWFPPVADVIGGAGSPPMPSSALVAANLAAPGLQVAALFLALMAVAAMLPSPWAVRAQLVLAVCELTLVLGPFRNPRSDPSGYIAQAEALRGQDRVVVVGNGGAIQANYGPISRVVQPAGYSALFNSAYTTLLLGNTNPGVAFDISRPEEPALRLLGYSRWLDTQAGALRVVEPEPPRAWVARCVWPGGAREAREAAFPMHTCITRASSHNREQPVSPAAATILAERSGWQMIAAEGPGWLVTSVPWYPGWSASIDGQAAVAEPVDGALVGVELPAGAHTVTVTYRPAGLELGVLLSLASALILTALVRMGSHLDWLAILSRRISRG
jgi:hypothetical protein